MKILGIDYGRKNIGLAISDEGESMAFPREVIQNDKDLFNNLERVIKEEEIGKFVVGDPGDYDIKEDVVSFCKKLEENFSLPLYMEKEFMTSMHSSFLTKEKPIARKSKSEDKKDDRAAMIILQRYLDKNKNND